MEMEEKVKERIIVDPQIMVGKPIIKGTRIPVDAIIRRLAEGMTIKEVLEDYPNITRDDVLAALEYCVYLITGEDVIPLTPR
jgi:uncharacterized protein (DUF433 family)